MKWPWMSKKVSIKADKTSEMTSQHLESRYFNWGCSSRSVDGINDAPHFSILVEVIENS